MIDGLTRDEFRRLKLLLKTSSNSDISELEKLDIKTTYNIYENLQDKYNERKLIYMIKCEEWKDHISKLKNELHETFLKQQELNNKISQYHMALFLEEDKFIEDQKFLQLIEQECDYAKNKYIQKKKYYNGL